MQLVVLLLLLCRLGCAHPPLSRLEPDQLGKERMLTLPDTDSHRTLTVKTVHEDPPIFVIDNFLSEEECRHIIRLANDAGLEISQTSNPTSDEDYDDDVIQAEAEQAWKAWNTDEDAHLTRGEILEGMSKFVDVVFTEEDVDRMLKELVDGNGDGVVDFGEFKNTKMSEMDRFVREVQESRPVLKVRYSTQTWLEQDRLADPVLQDLRERLIYVTGLPRVVVEASESLQVVHYDHRGHYHCHVDSDVMKDDDDDGNVTCCHHRLQGQLLENGCRCVLCRYMTLLYYLNDVTRGGATAFPFSDTEAAAIENHPDFNKFCNLSSQCDRGVVVRPKMGSAVLWYSHQLRDGGQIGEVDLRTYHGGCDVLEGEKWIANNWIDIDETFDYGEHAQNDENQRHQEL
eukprot:m.309813 g.309813  ORF g.309813 m.309813 type:complete len:400 (+) comp48022_c0_seq1:103-1302(+)